MTEFKKSKSLSIEVYRSRWSEGALARVAAVIQQHAGKVAIEIVTGDGEDRISTADPEFFRTSEMPEAIQSVKMSVRNGINCEVALALPGELGSAEPAKGSVSGADGQAVASLFRGLEKEFGARRLRGSRMVRFLHGPGGLLVTFVGCTTALVSLSMLIASVLSERSPGFVASRSGSGRALMVVGLGLTVALAVPLTGRALALISRSFPMIEFGGKLTPSNRFRCGAVVWLIGFVLLPLLLNLLSGVLLGSL